jgi:outer membrane protein TolC
MAQLVRSDTQSRSALRLAEERFASGVGDAVAVYRAREDVRQSRQRLLAARRLLLVNRIDLHLALGGGFAVPQS